MYSIYFIIKSFVFDFCIYIASHLEQEIIPQEYFFGSKKLFN
jgi:hypothetical protein